MLYLLLLERKVNEFVISLQITHQIFKDKNQKDEEAVNGGIGG